MFVVQTPLGAQPGFETQPLCIVPGDLWVEIDKLNDEHWFSEAALLTLLQSWPCGIQIVNN